MAGVKSTGMVRQVDVLGRIVLPMELRNTLHISPRDPMEIYVEGDAIILRKYEPACLFCGNATDLVDFKDRKICRECIEEMSK